MKGRIVQIEEEKYKIQVKYFLFWIDLEYDDPSYSTGGIGGRKCIYATIPQAEAELKDYLGQGEPKKFKPKVIKVIK